MTAGAAADRDRRRRPEPLRGARLHDRRRRPTAPTSAGTPSRASPPTREENSGTPDPGGTVEADLRLPPRPRRQLHDHRRLRRRATAACRPSAGATSTPTSARASCAASSPTCGGPAATAGSASRSPAPTSFGEDKRGRIYVASLEGPSTGSSRAEHPGEPRAMLPPECSGTSMSIRWIFAIAAALTAILFDAGCGGSDDSPTVSSAHPVRQLLRQPVRRLSRRLLGRLRCAPKDGRRIRIPRMVRAGGAGLAPLTHSRRHCAATRDLHAGASGDSAAALRAFDREPNGGSRRRSVERGSTQRPVRMPSHLGRGGLPTHRASPERILTESAPSPERRCGVG